jgi:hypothetical protein
MSNLIKKTETYFIILLIVSGVLFSLPSDLLMAVYTPNYLGWVVWLLITITLVLFVWLSIVSAKNQNYKKMFIRFIILIIVYSLSIGFKYIMQV